MRTPILALTILGFTAVTVYTAGGALVGSSETTDPTQKHQLRSGGVGGTPQGGFLRGYDRVARGDMTGSGGGGKMGGMMGDMMGSMGKGKGK